MIILDSIPFSLSLDDLLPALHVRPGSDDAPIVARLLEAAQAVARPKAAFRLCAIEQRATDQIVLEGVTLTSRVLSVNLEATHRAFVFVATCGAELAQWAAPVEGLLERFWVDTIQERALQAALGALRAEIDTRYRPGSLSMMNPGSLADWPLGEQRGLFSILAGQADVVGVRLTDSFLMQPMKSVSGLLFSSADTFESCQLCPLDDCPNRRAAFDPALYDRKYRLDHDA